jgi:uncharacterized membrane protein (DUF2068 family)
MLRRSYLSGGVRAVAVIEAAKAVLVLAAGCGLLSLVHRDVEDIAARLIRHFHLDPANKYPRIFVDAAHKLTDSRLMLLASLALLYATVRAVQAYGLWHERPWAEWLGVVTGSIYLPFEIYELARHVTTLKITTFLVNLAVVACLSLVLYSSHRQKAANRSR